MKKNTFFLFVVALFSAILPCPAEVTLPNVISSNMVLQQNSQAALWGQAGKGAKVTITTSWTKAKNVVTADADGNWNTRISTPSAGGPYTITISDGKAVTLENILIGEVWFCSGQSNMDMPVKGYPGQPVIDSEITIIDAKPSTPIRMFTVKKNPQCTPQTNCGGSWKENTPQDVAECSAVAYYFAQQVQRSLDVPVGIIVSTWGGTAIETWMSREVIEAQFPEIKTSHLSDPKTPNLAKQPCTLFNGMVSPVIPFTIKGWIWYQGESNRLRAEQYLRLQPAYAQMMRDLWGNQEMPFYYVQIAPYQYGYKTPENGARLQEVQQKALALIPHSGMATTADIGTEHCIHPPYKQKVGRRLAMLALSHDYGMKGFNCDAPVFDKMEKRDGKAIISFKGVSKLCLSPINVEVPGFEAAGADRIFHPATARIASNRVQIELSCKEVEDIVAVRYNFKNWFEGKLYDGFVPIGPFRTDDWPEILK